MEAQRTGQMLMEENTVHIAMISDVNYVIPTGAAIQSMISSKNDTSRYVFHIVASQLDEWAREQFGKFERTGVHIDVIERDAEALFEGLHTFDKNAACVASIAALLKFILPELLPELQKVLYLDGDLIVKTDLSELYQTDLEEYYAAAVAESSAIYYKGNAFINRVQRYFNSGVMLLNLHKMRTDHISEKLIQTKKELNDSSLMDQNVFNLVFDGAVKDLSIVWNFLSVNLDRVDDNYSIEQVNGYFGTDFKDKKEMARAAKIIHFSSKDKPWKTPDCANVEDWIEQYEKAPIPHEIPFPKNEEECAYTISVIMPCYNAEEYVAETLESVMNQTFRDFEVIAIDDGSTDHTLSILREYEKRCPNMTVVSDTNHQQGYQRNAGIRMAKGKYIYFMDSDDLIMPECFAACVRQMELCGLDLLCFEAKPFYETEELLEKFPVYQTLYTRNGWYPRVYGGKDLFCRFVRKDRMNVSVCMQFVRRKFLTAHQITFPEYMPMEDNLYTFRLFMHAERVKCISDVLLQRRIRTAAAVTTEKAVPKVTALLYTIEQEAAYLKECEGDTRLSSAIMRQINRTYEQVRNLAGKDADTAEGIYEALADRYKTVWNFQYAFQTQENERKSLNAKLQKTYDEKSELNAKLQVTYGEKSERGQKIKELEKETADLKKQAGEMTEKIRKLENTVQRLRAEINRKLSFGERISGHRKTDDF